MLLEPSGETKSRFVCYKYSLKKSLNSKLESQTYLAPVVFKTFGTVSYTFHELLKANIS